MSNRISIHQDIVNGGAGISSSALVSVAAGIRQMLAEPSRLAAMGQAGSKLVRAIHLMSSSRSVDSTRQ